MVQDYVENNKKFKDKYLYEFGIIATIALAKS